jgi:hypothetical protein
LERAFGPSERDRFVRDVTRTEDKALVYQAFERLGWSKASCAKKLEPNDVATQAERPRLMRALVIRAGLGR